MAVAVKEKSVRRQLAEKLEELLRAHGAERGLNNETIFDLLSTQSPEYAEWLQGRATRAILRELSDVLRGHSTTTSSGRKARIFITIRRSTITETGEEQQLTFWKHHADCSSDEISQWIESTWDNAKANIEAGYAQQELFNEKRSPGIPQLELTFESQC